MGNNHYLCIRKATKWKINKLQLIAMTTINNATVVIGKLGRDTHLKLGIDQDDTRPIVFHLHHVTAEERSEYARPGQQYIL